MARINFKHTYSYEVPVSLGGCEGEVEFEVELTCTGHLGSPAIMHPIEKAHPDEPAEVEVISRRIHQTGCNDPWRTPDQFENDRIDEWIDENEAVLIEAMSNHVASEQAEAEDRKFDQWRDDQMCRE